MNCRWHLLPRTAAVYPWLTLPRLVSTGNGAAASLRSDQQHLIVHGIELPSIQLGKLQKNTNVGRYNRTVGYDRYPQITSSAYVRPRKDSTSFSKERWIFAPPILALCEMRRLPACKQINHGHSRGQAGSFCRRDSFSVLGFTLDPVCSLLLSAFRFERIYFALYQCTKPIAFRANFTEGFLWPHATSFALLLASFWTTKPQYTLANEVFFGTSTLLNLSQPCSIAG